MGAVEAPGALTNRMVSTRITALGMLAVWLAVLSMFWKLLDSRRAVTEIVSAWLKTSTVKIRMASSVAALRSRLRLCSCGGGWNEALTDRGEVPGIMSATMPTYWAARDGVPEPAEICTRSWNEMAGNGRGVGAGVAAVAVKTGVVVEDDTFGCELVVAVVVVVV
jgi:hypothetical protein